MTAPPDPLSAGELEDWSAALAEVIRHHLAVIYALQEPYSPSVLSLLQGIGAFAMHWGLRVRYGTPFDVDALTVYAAALRRRLGLPTIRAAIVKIDQVLLCPLPAPGPFRCLWAQGLADAGGDLTATARGFSRLPHYGRPPELSPAPPPL